MDVSEKIKDRFFDLAVARSLQTARENGVDIHVVRQFIGGNDKCNAKFGSRFLTYKKCGAVNGEEHGKDANGYPYKRWRLVDASKAKEHLKNLKIKPMRAQAMTAWRVDA